MYKKIVISLSAIFVLASIISSCGNSENKGKTNQDSVKIKPQVSVYYLHQKKRCTTCKAVGNISKTTTETNFGNEIKEGKVAFFDLDISEPANDSIGKKFECAWSGLYILSAKEGKEKIEDLTDFGFMYAINKPDTLEQKIKSAITENL
jgi:hypothetical protein